MSPSAEHATDPAAQPSDGRFPAGLVLGVDHVGYAVADLDEALDLHARLGWLPVHRERNEEQGVEEAMLAPIPSGTRDADPDLPDPHLPDPDLPNPDLPGPDVGAQVQLLAPLTADSPIGRHLQRSGPGIQQVAYRVADLEAVSAVLVERGFRLVHPEARPGTGGTRINFIHPRDTGGVLIELVERPPGPPAADAAAPIPVRARVQGTRVGPLD